MHKSIERWYKYVMLSSIFVPSFLNTIVLYIYIDQYIYIYVYVCMYVCMNILVGFIIQSFF